MAERPPLVMVFVVFYGFLGGVNLAIAARLVSFDLAWLTADSGFGIILFLPLWLVGVLQIFAAFFLWRMNKWALYSLLCLLGFSFLLGLATQSWEILIATGILGFLLLTVRKRFSQTEWLA